MLTFGNAAALRKHADTQRPHMQSCETREPASQVFDDADAMAPSPAQVQEFHVPDAVIGASSASMASVDGSHDFDGAMIALSKLEAIEPVGSKLSTAKSRSASAGGKSGVSSSGGTESATASGDSNAAKDAVLQAAAKSTVAQKPRQPSPRELVAAKLQEAAAAAAAAAAPLASNLSHIGSFASHAVPMHLVASQLQSAALAGQSTAVATFATVTAALESSLQRDRGGKAVARPAARVDPVEWFVADDGETHTRYFVIQVRWVVAQQAINQRTRFVMRSVLVSVAPTWRRHAAVYACCGSSNCLQKCSQHAHAACCFWLRLLVHEMCCFRNRQLVPLRQQHSSGSCRSLQARQVSAAMFADVHSAEASRATQGSDNFDHWRTNLTFDPVPFEDPDLGVAVHRGVYETAQILYARFEPLVAEHLASSPFAKVAFTVRARGHELRGSSSATDVQTVNAGSTRC